METAPQEEYPDPARANPDDIEQQPTEYHITETPVGAERPPSPPSCSKCSCLSKTNRRLQKENAYLQCTQEESQVKRRTEMCKYCSLYQQQQQQFVITMHNYRNLCLSSFSRDSSFTLLSFCFFVWFLFLFNITLFP